MVYQIFAPILGQALRQGARYVYRGLRAQDRIIDYTYRRTGLYNRGVVRGVKHGLAGGQIVGGLASLGLNGGTTPDIEDGFQESRPGTKTSPPYKTRNRFTRRYSIRSRNKCYPYQVRRRSSFSKR